MEKLTDKEIRDLIEKSYKNRKNTIKLLSKGDGHIGGAFSSMDILTVLYNKIMKIDPKIPNTTMDKIWKALPSKYKSGPGRPRNE